MLQTILVGAQDDERGREALALGRVLTAASEAEMEVVTAPDEDGEDLAAIARHRQADLVVLGSSHRGALGRLVPGATVERLLGDAPCAVAVAPPGFAAGDARLRVIGVAFDDSDAAHRALAVATELALSGGAALRVYAVARKLTHLPGAGEPAQGVVAAGAAESLRLALGEAVAALPAEVRALPVFLRGYPADELIKAVDIGVDLMVLGARAGGPLRRAVHHSVSSFLLAEAHCPVLVIPDAAPTPPAAPRVAQRAASTE